METQPSSIAQSQPLLINRSLRLRNNQFYPEVSHKDSIFLHHTAGTTARGAFDWWNQTPEAVGTAYIIDRDGTIYEVFPPDRWGYHLGIKGDDNYMEKHSIGIELVATGPLKNVDEGFLFYPLWPLKTAKKMIPNSEVFHVKEGWREERFFQIYTDLQIRALQLLIPHLIKEFNMPISSITEDFYNYDGSVIKDHKPGVWAHSTVRSDKNDIFPYPKLIDSLTNLNPNKQ